MGGEKRIVCPCNPPLPSSKPISLHDSRTCAHSPGRLFGRAILHQANSRINPFPRTSPITLLLFSDETMERISDPERVLLQLLKLDLQHASLARRDCCAERVEVNPL